MGNRWYVITGGPCSGKTTLIQELARRGFRTVPEAARAILAAGRARGETVAQMHADELGFQRTVLAEKIRAEEALPKDSVAFLDRGIHDSAVYFARAGYADDPTLRMALRTASYSKAFLLALLPYTQDAERVETEAEAEALHTAIRAAYQAAGIPIIEVPVGPVEERADFVLRHL